MPLDQSDDRFDEQDFIEGSPGASERWLAVHEAGHAIVGIKAGFSLSGVRFHGSTGETGFEEFEWWKSTDDDLLCRHIRVDVAGNIAELIATDHAPDGGYPSQFFSDRKPVSDEQYPTDIIWAWQRAHHLATIRFENTGRQLDRDAIWLAAGSIVEGAELEAEQVLRSNLEALVRMADQLQRGPMTGTAARMIMNP